MSERLQATTHEPNNKGPHKYTFKTRFGRWLHCLIHFHRAADLDDAHVYYCFTCAEAHEKVVKKLKGPPRWVAVPDDPRPDDTEEFWRVRWSEPDEKGRYLYVRHYGGNGTAWNKRAAEGDAARFNEQGRRPSEWPK
jgi:hypothetical protein